MKASTEIISSNSGKMTPFMKLSWERLFTSSSFWARYHPVIIRFCLCVAEKSPFVYEHLRNTNIFRLASERTLPVLIKTGRYIMALIDLLLFYLTKLK